MSTQQLLAWLESRDIASYRRPGLNGEQLAEFEAALRCELPPEIRALYAWSDGLGEDGTPDAFQRFSFMSSARVLEIRTMLDGLLEAGDFEGYLDWWDTTWIPLFESAGGDHVCLDPVGAYGGTPGQVLLWIHDDTDRAIVSGSFQAWFDMLVDGREEVGGGYSRWVSATKAPPKPKPDHALADKLLTCFSERMSLEEIDKLIAQGARVDPRDATGKTPLHLCMNGASTKLGELLVDRGADVNAADNDGNTPLHHAVLINKRFVVKFVDFLVQRGADPNRANKEGRTPLFWASTPEAVNALARNGASAAHRDARGRTALEYRRATFPDAAVMAALERLAT